MVGRRQPIFLLGTFHFTSKRDMFVAGVGDMRTPTRQEELEDLVARLSAFRPSKILLELPYGDAAVDRAYAGYLGDDRKLDGNEGEQIGFRLARRLGHDRVYGIDIMHRWHEPDVEKLIESSPRCRALWDEIQDKGKEGVRAFERRQATSTVTELLREMNRPPAVRDNLAVYLRSYARLVEGDEYAGADMVGNWYHRNVRIYANLLRVIDADDRVFALYGAGHIPVLTHLIDAAGTFERVDPLRYLDPGLARPH